jgi:ACS family pantothenate transporter-like MFS transporter
VAIYGFLLFPDTPRNTTAPYLTTDEKALAISRVPEVSERTPISWAFLKHCFGTWYWYMFVVLWILAGETESFSTNALLQLYMTTRPEFPRWVLCRPCFGPHSPTSWVANGTSVCVYLVYFCYEYWLTAIVGYWIGITGVITSALILAYPHSTSIHFVMYYWAGSVYACQATFFAWANDVLRYEEDSLRAVVIASMNMGSNAINAWWSIVFYGANFAPYFTRGMYAMIAVSIAMGLWTGALVWMQVRTERRREIHGGVPNLSTKEHDMGDVENIHNAGQGREKV